MNWHFAKIGSSEAPVFCLIPLDFTSCSCGGYNMQEPSHLRPCMYVLSYIYLHLHVPQYIYMKLATPLCDTAILQYITSSSLTKGIVLLFGPVIMQYNLFKRTASVWIYSCLYLLGHFLMLLVTSPTVHPG